jgi:hypothetical protein
MPNGIWWRDLCAIRWTERIINRQEAVKCYELAKHAQPAYLGDFYRRIVVRYMFMAEDLLTEARARGDAAHRAIIARGGASAEQQ